MRVPPVVALALRARLMGSALLMAAAAPSASESGAETASHGVSGL